MAGRPIKKTIEFFPHFVSKGKKLTIIEHRFGVKGYACYYKLQEILGKSDLQFYEFQGVENKYYALTELGLEESDFEDMMNLFVELNILDSDLWKEKKIIWWQSFIDELYKLWNKRTIKPEKPSLDEKGNLLINTNPISDELIPISDELIQHSNSNSNSNSNSRVRVRQKEVNTPHSNIPSWALDFGKQYPDVNINLSYKKFELNKRSNGKPLNKDSFEYWVMNDHEKGWNLKKPEKPINTTLYCTHCPNTLVVPSNKEWGHTCECEGTMVHKSELVYYDTAKALNENGKQ